jgi:ssDNA-binding Zn-finger/Zn-ribbon topoisomerase 1
MGSIGRRIEVEAERKKIKEIQKTYGKKPKEICPKCHKKSIFFTNKKGELFCIRCDQKVK